MISVWEVADRLRYRGKHKGERALRLLRHVERSTGRTLVLDHGESARPRYWVDEETLGLIDPTFVEGITVDPDARIAELMEEVESLRELHTTLVRRVAALEAVGRGPRRAA